MAGKRRRKVIHRNMLGGFESFSVVNRSLEVLIFSLGDSTITYTSTDHSFMEVMDGFLKGMKMVPSMKGTIIERIAVPLR